MTSYQLLQCPFCQSAMQLPPNLNTPEVLCPSCQNRVAIAQPLPAQMPPQAEPVPSPLSPSGPHAGAGQQGPNMLPSGKPPMAPVHSSTAPPASRNGVGCVIVAVLVGAVLMIIALAIGIGIYLMIPSKTETPPLAQENRKAKSLDDFLNDDVPGTDALPITPAQSETDPGKSGLGLTFKRGEEYSYRFELNTKINDQEMSYSGINNFRPTSSLQPNSKIGVKAQTISYSTTMTTFRKSGGRLNIPQPVDNHFDRGTLLIGQDGDYYSDEQETMVPLLMKPLGMVGLERISGSSKTWKDDQEVILTEVEQVKEDPYDPLSRYRHRMSRSPYRRPGITEPRPKVTTTIINRQVTYRVESESPTQIRVAKTLRIAPQQASSARKSSTTVNATGYFVYDKKLKLITQSQLKGNATVTEGSITLKIPFEYSETYRSKEEILAAAARRKKNAEKNKTAAKTPTRNAENSGTSAVKSEANTKDVSKLVVGTIDKVTWGAKGLAVAKRGDQTFLAVIKMDRHVQVYDWEKQMMTDETERLDDAGHGTCAAASPDGTKVLYGGYSGPILVYDLDDHGKLKSAGRFNGHSKEIKFIRIAKDGKTVISGGQEKKLRVWSLQDNKETAVVAGFQGTLLDGCFSDDLKTALVSDGRFVYNVDLEKETIRQKTKMPYCSEVCFSEDGKLYAEREGVRIVTIRDTTDFKEVAKFETASFPRHLDFSPDNRQLYFGTHGFAHVIHLESKRLESFKVHKTFGLEGIAFSPDGNQCAIATGASGGQIVIMKRPE